METANAVPGVRGLSARLNMVSAIILFTFVLAAASNAAAENDGHPLFTPIAGSFVQQQEVMELDEQQLVIGKVQQDGTVKTEKLEGKVTKIDYRDPDNRSSLDRFRTYEQALKKTGFTIVYSCSKEACGPEIQIETIGFYPPERYLAAFKKRTEGNVWIGVFVAAGPWTKVRIVEEPSMAPEMDKVSGVVVAPPPVFKPQQLPNKKVKLGEGVYFELGDYIAATSFRNHPTTKHFFDTGFRTNFLTKDAQYTEEVVETEDRVVVTRTLVLNMKDPCAPGSETGGFSLCFKPKSNLPVYQKANNYSDRVRADQSRMLSDLKGSFDVKTHNYLIGVRAKIEKQLKANPNDPEAFKVKNYISMSDSQLLDQLLNKADSARTKKIIHTSVVPYIAYEFRKVPSVDVFDLSRPLPRTNQFLFKSTNSQSVTANLPDILNAARFPARPSMTSFSPERGKNKETITIRGTNLDSVTSVMFVDGQDEIPLAVESRGTDQIVAEVYGWAGSKKVRLGWAGGTIESSQDFLLYFDPLTGLPPARGNGPNGQYVFENATTINAKYLTGFTFSKTFGDHYHVQFADETAFTDSYFANFSWGLSAGFGLRWPFEVTATSAITKVYGQGNPGSPLAYPATQPSQLCSGIDIEGEAANRNAHLCAQAAEVKVRAKGPGEISDSHFNAAFYRATGLPEDKIFDGKEFVFELGMTCRFYASIPGPNIGAFYCPSDMTFEPFKENSQFSPQLGSTRKDFINFEIEGRPLGLALELGIGYVGFNPGVALGGRDGAFTLDVNGYRSRPDQDTIAFNAFDTDKKINVTEETATVRGINGGNWGVDFSNPAYKVTATLTPTMSVVVGVGIGPFGWDHRFGPFSVDALSVDIGTGQFERHEGTKGSYEMRTIGIRPIKPPEPL